MLQREHSAILLTFIKLPFVIKIYVLLIFEWPFYTSFTVNGSAHEISVLIAYAQTPPINARADVSSETRGLNFGLSLHLQPCFVYASREGSGESAHMRRLARSFTAR